MSKESPVSAVGRTISLFGVVGFGLGLGGVSFLWSSGFFGSSDADDIGAAFVGGITIAAVLTFTLLIGIVLAAVGGLYCARVVDGRGRAWVAAMLGATLGHVALVASTGIVLWAGISLADTSTDAEPTPVPAEETRMPEELQECRDLFGEDSILCQAESEPEPPAESSGGTTALDLESLLKLALGLVPAGLVAALVATIFYRRERVESPMPQGLGE